MKIRTGTLRELKLKGQRFSCLTSYDALTARVFDAAGIEVLLVGDSASNTVLGYQGTVPITLEEMIPFGRAVAGASKSALVVFDLPFGSYEFSAEQAFKTATAAMKETGAAAVKLEGDKIEQIKVLVNAGIPVMGHVGFTPQSVHALSGFKVQGRGERADELLSQCLEIEAAGAFAIVLEMVPAELASKISKSLKVPTIGIGAGAGTDGQILVWTDFAGLSEKIPSFAKPYLDLQDLLQKAAQDYRRDVIDGSFPSQDQSFS
jgi:3-methyl-2-oxobutanoate hydroxymethyltransferase